MHLFFVDISMHAIYSLQICRCMQFILCRLIIYLVLKYRCVQFLVCKQIVCFNLRWFALYDLARTMEEEWEFITHPENIGYRVVVYETVRYDTIDQIIRQRYGLSQYTPLVISHRLPNWMLGPQGNRAPPMTISSTAVLSWLLHGRTWISELPMLITMGPKDIAEYEFHYRTNFQAIQRMSLITPQTRTREPFTKVNF